MSATCRSCGAPIVWAITSTGKRMPLDAVGSDKGTMFLVGLAAIDFRSELPDAVKARSENAPRYTSHFATCAHAAQHRKPR